MKLLIILLAVMLLALPASADIEKDGKIVVAIDPGHGGIDGGSDKGTYPEKYYNLKIAKYLKDALEADGRFTVVMTREEDIYLKYLPRVNIAREAHADVLLSLHCNTIGYSYVDGSSAYISLVERFSADELAGKLLDAISEAVPIRRGKVYHREDTGDSYGVYYWDSEMQWDMPGAWWLGKVSDYYSINTWGSKFGIPSIIIEHGYLSNAADLAVLDVEENLRAIAQAEADALIQFYTGHEHQFGEYTVDHPSNCTFTGTESRRCTICGARSGVRDLPAAPDNHFWRQTSSADATCESNGHKSYVCQISFNTNDKGIPCTVHEYGEAVIATGHSYTVISDTYPTHDSNGLLHKVCSNCGHEIREVRAGEGHNWELSSQLLPTCEEDGLYHYLCTVCDETKDEVLPATGHSYEVIEDRAATHTEDGILRQRCSACGKEISELRAAEGHSFELLSEAPPTCLTEGTRTEKCSVCDEEKETVLPATGHLESAEGEQGRLCVFCGTSLEQITEKRPSLPLIIAGTALILAAAAIGILIIVKRTKKPRSAFDITITADSQTESDSDKGIPSGEAEEIHVEYDEATNTPENIPEGE